MKREQFLEILRGHYERLLALTNTKGEEYKGGQDDQLGNFRRMSARTGLLMEQVWQVFFHKHVDAIDTFIRDKVAGQDRERSESIESRIDDALLYLVLLRAILRDQQTGTGHWLASKPDKPVIPSKWPKAVFVAGAESDMALQNEIRHSNISRQSTVTFVSSTDHMHGVPVVNTEVLWAGLDHDNPMYSEWARFCEDKGYTFRRWFRS